MRAVEVRGVVKRFGSREALRGVDLELDEGGELAVLGPNGSGKTTLLRIVLGVLRPDQGLVRVFERDPREARGLVGYVSQSPLSARGRVHEVIELHAKLFGIGGAEARRRARELLEALELEHLMDRRVEELSFGQRRVVQVVRELVHGPRLLVGDELTMGMDPRTRRKVLELLDRWRRESGSSIIIATHSLYDVEALGARAAILVAGRKVAELDPSDVARLGREFARVVAVLDRDVGPLTRGRVRALRSAAFALVRRSEVPEAVSEIEKLCIELGCRVLSVSIEAPRIDELLAMMYEGSASLP